MFQGPSAALSLLSFVFFVLYFEESCSFHNGNIHSVRSSIRSSILFGRHHYNDEIGSEGSDLNRQRKRSERPWLDRPPIVETDMQRLGTKPIPEKPKIVVLGATGRVGRYVVKQLMQTKSVGTVVAFVRDYDKAFRVLYDDVLVVRGPDGIDVDSMNRNPRGSPKLEIVEGNLVPPEEMPGYNDEESEDYILWKKRAESAARFFGNEVQDYDNRELIPDVDESLIEALTDCTAIICCVGSVRVTHLWHDVLSRPFVRLLKADVSSWCRDERHPYYVHYAATRKVLGYAEREQVRREASAIAVAESEGLDLEDIYIPRIRFIRISNLSVEYSPLHIVSVITNAVHSLVLRYQEMAENLLDESTLVETVILRPLDLVDDARDEETTSVQVCSTGRVSSPAIVGREDVAAIAVAAAAFESQNKTNDNGNYGVGNSKTRSGNRTEEPFHYKFALRWCGPTLDSYPSQGRKRDGLETPELAFERELKIIYRREREAERRTELKKQSGWVDSRSRPLLSLSASDMIARMSQNLERRRRHRRGPNRMGFVQQCPIYLFLTLLGKMVLSLSLQHIPNGKEVINPFVHRINNWVVSIIFIATAPNTVALVVA